MLKLDHLVFGARDLETGRAWMEARLGVAAQGGGVHPGMGSHNALWRLGDAYLEVLAVDPAAPAPTHARMYGLGAPDLAARYEAAPALIAWVAAADDLDAALAAAPIDFGRPMPMSRGDLSWRLTLTADGSPPFGGALPALIDWPPGAHPAARMAENGLRLRSLTAALERPEDARAALAPLGYDGPLELRQADGPARLSTVIETAAGPVAFG